MCLPNVEGKISIMTYATSYTPMGWHLGASALKTVDYNVFLLKQGQFHCVTTETNTPSDTLRIIRNNKNDPLYVTRLDEL